MELPKNFKFLQNTDPSYQNHCETCLQLLADEFDHKRTKNIRLSMFSELLGEKDFTALGKWSLSDGKGNFNFIVGSYTTHHMHATSYSVSNKYDTHLYCFGHLTLGRDLGHVFIRPESLIDKVSELFTPVEIDFEGQETFNKKYYCLSEHKQETIKSFPREILNLIGKYDNLSIEIVKNHFLFRLPKALDQKESLLLCEFGFELSQLIAKL